jgi:stalled ribosome rescue protein Dom34
MSEKSEPLSHAVVWIDHQSARIVHFDRERSTMHVVHAHKLHVHLHHKANSRASGHAPEDQAYLDEVARAIGQAPAVLLTGPSNEKLELRKHIERHEPQLAMRIAAVQPLDHPSDGELLAHGRAFFRVEDRMRAQT